MSAYREIGMAASSHRPRTRVHRERAAVAVRGRETRPGQGRARLTERRVMFRDPGDYDDLFGVRYDPTTGEVL